MYLCDMGLTKLIEDGASVTIHSTEGTYSYMAPECFDRLARKSCKVDVYSFGCVLIELFTEKKVWGDFGMINIFQEVAVKQSAPKFSVECPQLQTLIESCLSREAQKRPTFGHIIEELPNMTKSS